MREKHQDWEALLERALAEECSAPANLLELVRNENGAAVFNRFSSHPGRGPWLFVPALIQFYYIRTFVACIYTVCVYVYKSVVMKSGLVEQNSSGFTL